MLVYSKHVYVFYNAQVALYAFCTVRKLITHILDCLSLSCIPINRPLISCFNFSLSVFFITQNNSIMLAI